MATAEDAMDLPASEGHQEVGMVEVAAVAAEVAAAEAIHTAPLDLGRKRAGEARVGDRHPHLCSSVARCRCSTSRRHPRHSACRIHCS